MNKKYIVAFLLIFLVCMKGKAQTILVPNGDFEIWDNLGTFSAPDNWPTSDLLWHFNGYATNTVKSSTKSHSGKYAARIGPDTAGGKIWPAFMVSKFPFKLRPHHLVFYHLDSLGSFNSAGISVSFLKYNPLTHNNDSIGGGVWTFPVNISSSYSYTEIPISFLSSDTTIKPDTASINILIKSNPTALKQGHILLDDVSLKVHNSGIEPNDLNEQISIYPNPAARFINVACPTKQTVGYMEIMDLNGKLIRQERYRPGRSNQIDISTVPAGVYVLQIKDTRIIGMQKIVIEK
jgi:hypothetical protein